MLVKREERTSGEPMNLEEFLRQAETLYGLVTGKREESSVAQATWEEETAEGAMRPFMALVAAYGGAAEVISRVVVGVLGAQEDGPANCLPRIGTGKRLSTDFS